MNKLGIAILILVVIGGGFLLWQQFSGQPADDEVPQNGGDLEIVTQSNVDYFEGANGYFVRPEAEGAYPGVVMIHENRGLRPEIRRTAEELAKEGYLVLAVDLLGGAVVETQDEARALTANFDQEEAVENMNAAITYLRGEGATSLASLGWCFGGGQSLQLALARGMNENGPPLGLDATVIYYGRLATTTMALRPIQWPVLGIFGGEDQSISVESVNQFGTALDSLGVPNEIYIYPGVGHAFANPSNANHAPEETADAWAKTLAFLHTHLK
jgi:carboxymethylenebutenolidase